jgi:vitamin K-dependent gamma-carboxylase
MMTTMMTTTINPSKTGHNRMGLAPGQPRVATASSQQRINNRLSALFSPVDIAPLVLFRVGFGALMLWEVWRYFRYDRIGRYYVEPSFHFNYYGFDWLTPLPGDGMFYLFYVLGALSILIMFGVFYRLSMLLFWLCFTYVFLLDQAQYLNHFYLISLASFLMIFVPAHRALSVDAWLRPGLRAQVAPNWSLWLLRGQMAVVYFFGGVNKVNPDWLRGEPMRMWLAARTDFPWIGHLFTEEWMVYLFSYGGMLFDLLIVPLLFWHRTRLPALLLAIAFHLTNDELFNIGVFPWFGIAATLLFLPPGWFRLGIRPPAPSALQAAIPHRQHGLIVLGIVLFFTPQILLPLRSLAYPGYSSWTEEGHNFAWNMKLRSKRGNTAFYASDPQTGSTWSIALDWYLSDRQIGKMTNRPQQILRFADHVADQLAAEGYPDIEIRVWSMISLNARPAQLLIDPTADLVRQPVTLGSNDWVLPLYQPPRPGDAVPVLLISRRYDDALVLINMVDTPYPLAEMELRSEDAALSGADFGVSWLESGECVLAHLPEADLRHVLVPCDETGSRQVIGDALLEGTMHIHRGADIQQVCEDKTCHVPVEAQG